MKFNVANKICIIFVIVIFIYFVLCLLFIIYGYRVVCSRQRWLSVGDIKNLVKNVNPIWNGIPLIIFSCFNDIPMRKIIFLWTLPFEIFVCCFSHTKFIFILSKYNFYVPAYNIHIMHFIIINRLSPEYDFLFVSNVGSVRVYHDWARGL